MGSFDSSAGPTVRGTSSFPSQRDSLTASGTEGLMERFKARMNALRDQGKWCWEWSSTARLGSN